MLVQPYPMADMIMMLIVYIKCLIKTLNVTMEYIPWTAVCSNYQLSGSGIKYPTKFSAIWNYPDEDFIYFDGKISNVRLG